MIKAIELSKKIIKDLGKDWMDELEEINLHFTLGAIYNIPHIDIDDKNRIICFIILSYSPESKWLDLNKDRIDNKKNILTNLGANINSDLYKMILSDGNDIVGMCTFNYLEELKDWRWPAIFNLLDFSSKMQRFSSKETESEKSWDELSKDGNIETLTEELDIEKIVKVNKQKGELLHLAIQKREQAESLLEKIRKDFLQTDIASQADFGFKFTDTSKKKDIMSWRQYIKNKIPANID